MARARNIKPAFFTNEILGTLDPIIGMTFVGLWCLADKTGRLEDRPLRIKAELFPYREGTDVNGYLTVLERHGFVERYEVDGVKLIQVVNFEKHQSPHHTEKPKGYPPKPKSRKASKDLTVKQPLSDGNSQVPTRSDSLIPDSLIPDSLIPVHQDAPAAAPRFDARKCLAAYGVDEKTAEDWLTLRKSKKSPATETAIDRIAREANKAGLSMNDALALCCSRGWTGFEAGWVDAAKPTQVKRLPTRDERHAFTNASLTGRIPPGTTIEQFLAGDYLRPALNGECQHVA